ncbi:sugar porter family MFS transporter [candidate division KSB1 bacterium]|nr:sugar porter family MFS transporter [candidate division KSB1 bacterium]
MNPSRNRLVYFSTFVAALGGLLFGYDTAVISGAIGFLRQHFDLSSAQMGWTASSALVGCVAGVSVAGILSDRFGRNRILIVSAALFLISAIGSALAGNVTVLIIYRILGGIGVGIASMLSPLYIAEISPARIRGKMVSYNQLAIVSGMLIVYFVNYLIAKSGAVQWNIASGWRWMFASEALPAALFLIMLLLVPNSPRWLIKQGREQEAMDVLNQISGPQKAQIEAEEIRSALAMETGSLTQLFKSGLRPVLIIGVVLAILQQVTGINVFLYYAPEIFKNLGSGTDIAFLQTVIVGAFNLGFTIIAIHSVDRWGRKPLMLTGSAGMGLCLAGMGLAAFYSQTAIWVLVFVLGYISFFALSVGPVTWVILSEIYPTRIRGRALSIATFFLWSANWLVSQTFPMLDENPFLVGMFNHAFSFWLYGLLCVVLFVFVWKGVPETKGKSLEGIEKEWTRD